MVYNDDTLAAAMGATRSASPGSSATGRFVVSVEKWSGGWDLHIDGDGLHSGGGVTQVTSLDDAEVQVRQYLRSVFDADFSHAVIDIALPETASDSSW